MIYLIRIFLVMQLCGTNGLPTNARDMSSFSDLEKRLDLMENQLEATGQNSFLEKQKTPNLENTVNNLKTQLRYLLLGMNDLQRKISAGSRVDHNAVTKQTNIAYGKPVTASSKHYVFSPENAVDGNIKNFMHTEAEDKPWFLIDLGGIFMIEEIEIINRQDCCGERLHDVQLTVGKNSTEDIQFWWGFSEPASTGERIGIRCPINTQGQFVKIQIVHGSKNVLNVAEILVWGKKWTK